VCEGWAGTFKHVGVPENSRGIVDPEADDSLIGLAPLFIKQSCAGGGTGQDGLQSLVSLLVSVHLHIPKQLFSPADSER
jgi:hypothetical protein